MKSGKKPKFRDSVFSRLVFTYMAIMLMMLVGQSVLLGNIYQNEYYNERKTTLSAEAAGISMVASTAYTATSSDDRAEAMVSLANRVAETVRRQNAMVWIVSKSGTVNYMTPEMLDASATGKVPEFKKYEYIKENFVELNNEVLHRGVEVESRDLVLEDGTKLLSVGVPILYKNVPVGAVFMHTKMQMMYAVVERMYRYIAVSALGAFVIGILLIWVVSSRISRPLSQMNSIAGHIARGSFDGRVNVHTTNDEIGQLAESFNAMAEELKKQEELRSSFVANVSHELRSPMTSIHGFAQGMLDGTIPSTEHAKYMEVIVGETRRLNKLIRELLDLSQIESGKFPLNIQPFDVNELIRRVLISFEEKIEAKNQEIDVDFKQDRAMVHADSDRIEQVVINLLDNAVKFTPDCGRIRIWTYAASDKMFVGVGDSGPGIPLEDQAYVWERFYKVDKSHTGKKGTGLGLSIVKKIIDQHGERITLQSQPGSGTVFVFSLKKADNG